MIIGLDAVTTANALTTVAEQVVIVTSEINPTGDDLFQDHTADGTNIVYTARYDHGQLTGAINEWTRVVATTGNSPITTYTYADQTWPGTVVTLHGGTSNLTSDNTVVFDTDVFLGGPTRVSATFTVTSGGASTTWGSNLNATRLEKKQVGGFTVWVPREPTEEEKAEEAARLAAYEVHRQRALAEQKVADDKAETLLRKILTPKQRMELDQHGYFHVWAKDGFKYRINRSSGHNVSRVCPETGKPIQHYCIVPKIFVPSSDRLLAQKLLLEADPERFVSLSNVYKS